MTDAVCWMTRVALSGLEPEERLGAVLGAHAETCLLCQAEAARYRMLRRACKQLESSLLPAPQGFATSVEAAVRDVHFDRQGGSRIQSVAAAGAAAVVAAGTVAVLRRLRGVA